MQPLSSCSRICIQCGPGRTFILAVCDGVSQWTVYLLWHGLFPVDRTGMRWDVTGRRGAQSSADMPDEALVRHSSTGLKHGPPICMVLLNHCLVEEVVGCEILSREQWVFLEALVFCNIISSLRLKAESPPHHTSQWSRRFVAGYVTAARAVGRESSRRRAAYR